MLRRRPYSVVLLDEIEKAHPEMARDGFDEAYSARPLQRHVRRTLEKALTRAILAGDIADGDHIRAHADLSLTVEPAPPASSRSFVYATFGSVAGGLGVAPYRALLDAVDGLDVRVLLTTGAGVDLGPVPENVRVERWVPQAEALAHASLVVCHGGSGTVLGALAAGIPLVLMPLFADQFANAHALEAAGAARVVEPPELRAAIAHPPPPPLALARELRAAPPPLTALRRALLGDR